MAPKSTDDLVCNMCRVSSDGRYMIQCDRCDKHFHGRCMGIAEEAEGLALYWYCGECCRKFALTPVWRRKCRLPDCWQPARVSERSKYCCNDHGIAFFRLAIERAEAVDPQDLSTLFDSAKDAQAFRELEPAAEKVEETGETEKETSDNTPKLYNGDTDNGLCNCLGCTKAIDECQVHKDWRERQKLINSSAPSQLPMAWAAGVVRHTEDGGPNVFTPYVI